jgi:YD repeat-containing protein
MDLADRIIKVNHAGEHGAISIYSGQILMARLTARDLLEQLVEFRSEEQKHNYMYDSANRLQSIVQGSETVSLVYDAANRRKTLTLPNGVTVAYGFDNAKPTIPAKAMEESTKSRLLSLRSTKSCRISLHFVGA